MKNPDFLIGNLDFLLKNVDFEIKQEALRAEEATILAELAALEGGGASTGNGRRSLLSRARRSNGGGADLDAGLMAAVASLGDDSVAVGAGGERVFRMEDVVSAEDAAAVAAAMARSGAPPRGFGISSGQLLVGGGGSHHRDVNPLAQALSQPDPL